MFRTLSNRRLVLAAFAVIFVVSLLRPGGALQAAAGFLVLSFLPGLALVRLAFRGTFGSMDSIIFACALSPLVATGASIFLLLAGVSAWNIYLILGVSSAALFAIGFLPRAPKPADEASSYSILWLVAALAVVVIIPIASNGALRFRSDAWFHAAVVERIAQGGLPPTDPFYAGVPLRYFWAYHVYLLVLKSACGSSSFNLMAAINVLFFALYLLALHRLSQKTTRWVRAPLWSMILAVFGINILGWIFLMGRAFLGDNRGVEVLNGMLHSGVYAVLQQLSFHYSGSLAFFLDKFLVGSPFAMALVFFLLSLDRIVAWLEKGERSNLVLAPLFAVSAIMFHTVIGISLVGCSSVALIFLAAFGRMRRHTATPGRSLWVVLALVFSLILCLPYLKSIIVLRERAGRSFFNFNAGFAWTVLAAGILPVFLFVVRCVKRGLARDGEIFLTAVMGAAFILGAFAPLPLGNANKFIYLVFLPLIVLSSDGLARLSALFKWAGGFRYLGMIFLVVSAVATAFFALEGYVLDTGVEVPVAVRGGALRPTESESRGYAWIRENTPTESVFMNGARNDIVVMGPRPQLWTEGTYAVAWGYGSADIEWRSRLTEDIYAGRVANPETWARALGLGAPLYCMLRPADTSIVPLERIRAALPAGSAEVFSNEAFNIIRISP